jgi:hypothetical protein
MMYIILMTSNIVTDLVTNIAEHYCIDPLLDYLSKFDYFHIQMDFVILYGSTEWKICDDDDDELHLYNKTLLSIIVCSSQKTIKLDLNLSKWPTVTEKVCTKKLHM